MARKSQVTGAIQGTKPLYEYELLLEGGTWVPVTDSRDPVELEAFIKVQQGGGSWVRLIMQGGKEEFVGDWAAVKGFRFARKETPAFGVSNEG